MRDDSGIQLIFPLFPCSYRIQATNGRIWGWNEILLTNIGETWQEDDTF